MPKSVVHFRLVCDQRPPERRDGIATEFGLQDKARALLPGTVQANGALRFDFTVGVDTGTGLEKLRLGGPFVHGKPGERFLYLGWRPLSGAVDDWIRRWKVSLAGITPEKVAVLSANEGLVLDCRAAGAGLVWIDVASWERFEFDRAEESAAVA